MSNLTKLAHDINDLVNGFVRTSNDPNMDYENTAPRAAVRGVIRKKVREVLDRWNAMLEKSPQKDYEILQDTDAVDLRIKCVLKNNRYYVSIIPEINPSRNVFGETQLKPICNAMGGSASVMATKFKTPGNSSFEIYEKDYLKFDKAL